MGFHLRNAISDGFRRTLTKSGGLLFVGLLIIQIGTQTTLNTATSSYFPTEVSTQTGMNSGLILPVSGPVALALFAALLVFSAAFSVVIARAMVQPIGELSTVPADATRRLGRTTLAMLIGGTVLSILVFLGSLFLLIPGLFLATSFLFILFTIATEERGVIGGFKRSWALASGSRIKLFALVVLAAVFGGVIGGIAPLLTLASAPATSEVLLPVVTAVFMTPYYGILAASYLQLRGDQSGANRRSPEPVDASGTPEL